MYEHYIVSVGVGHKSCVMLELCADDKLWKTIKWFLGNYPSSGNLAYFRRQ
jgi:hypothetical protein